MEKEKGTILYQPYSVYNPGRHWSLSLVELHGCQDGEPKEEDVVVPTPGVDAEDNRGIYKQKMLNGNKK